MSDGGLVLRDAEPADAPALGRLVVRTWRHAYAEILPPDVLEDLDADERAGAWERLITGQDAAATSDARPGAATPRVLVSTLAGEVVGVAAGEAAAGSGEVRALYVAPHAQGAGVGRALLEALVRALRDAGAASVTLRVLAGAWWAQALFRSAGWRHDDAAQEPDLEGAAVQRWVLDP